MRILSLIGLSLLLTACKPVAAQDPVVVQDPIAAQDFVPESERTAAVSEAAKPLVAAARARLDASVVYDPSYVGIDYPNGDVPATMGVCTDVVIRSLRKAYGFDLQKAVHEDMKANFSVYPALWGHTKTDKNIDHRRVPNLEIYFYRMGHDLPITKDPKNYKPGDIVAWRLDGNTGNGGPAHIGIVSERLGVTGIPLIIHNVGGGPEESDMLFEHQITGHYRVVTDSN